MPLPRDGHGLAEQSHEGADALERPNWLQGTEGPLSLTSIR